MRQCKTLGKRFRLVGLFGFLTLYIKLSSVCKVEHGALSNSDNWPARTVRS